TGYPLAVDSMYGQQDAFYLSEVKGKKYQLGKQQEERPLMSRVSLHAYELSFVHPFTGEKVAVAAPLPKDFRAVLNQLRKWAAE
ncbi:MAG: RluA family pseudouridine synthase, partial [Phaeodactylibacter sp.]|nr:RluA family pseudouridine synthase [Phaeodactylibacter sp.]